ncbi:MAG: twin-arginine translocase subunit TatC [Candidatus Omnitrophica bacterium]|nr:twin-arginine translocase subunit TatC [Candidatus Omnitrophota bacterium]
MFEDQKLSLVEHLEELRSGIIKSVIFIVAGILCAYAFVDSLLPALIKPVGKLVFIAPQEAFVARITIAFFGGLFVASPFVLYQIWQFVSGGLNERERKYIRTFGPLSLLLFILGVCFCYFIIIPISMKFLLGFAGDVMEPMITVSKYISFVGILTLAFGVVFELPLAALFLTKIGMITPGFLSEKRKHAVVIMFIVSAVLTPPDVITQCFMVVPLLLLYEAGIIFSKAAYRKRT